MKLSNCCQAPIINGDFCSACKEHCVEEDNLIDSFIRDITKIIPMSKSEARRRLDEILNNNENKDWQEEFDKKFHCDYEPDEFNIYASPSKVKQFISDLLKLKNNNK